MDSQSTVYCGIPLQMNITGSPATLCQYFRILFLESFLATDIIYLIQRLRNYGYLKTKIHASCSIESSIM
jgi:hypothetical protein